jgi:hypothetical protein
MVWAARVFGAACTLLRRLRPSLLVVSDTVDRDRLLALAAHHCHIPCLATSHGIQMWRESYLAPYPLADVHCFYGGDESVLAGRADLPGRTARRIVCHDRPGKVEPGRPVSG